MSKESSIEIVKKVAKELRTWEYADEALLCDDIDRLASLLESITSVEERLEAVDGKCPKCGEIFWTKSEIVKVYERAKKFGSFFDEDS